MRNERGVSRKNKPTFLCSDAVLGLSGVVFMLAGVAATGEEEVFSIMSAGIFLFFVANIPRVQRNYGPRIATPPKKMSKKTNGGRS